MDYFDMKLFRRMSEWLEKAEAGAIKVMASGSLEDWGQYQRKVGYRKAIADVRIVLKDELDALIKE